MKKTKSKTILAIETSCDDTAIALVKCSGTLKSPKFEVLENIISSQIAIHRPFGGVVPNLAKREHLKNLPKIFKRIMNQESRIGNGKKKSAIHNSVPTGHLPKGERFIIPAIDSIAVTVGPGLEPALWTGINFAQELSVKLKKPLIGVNHMEGHLYSNWLPKHGIMNNESGIKNKKSMIHNSKFIIPKVQFPAIALVVSGGHTILLHMTAINKWTKLGETLDDAAGEAFDKVARMLKLPYPGGPEIQKLASKGNPDAIKFPRPMLNKPNYDFSFSGLKTSVLYYIHDHPEIFGSLENGKVEADQRRSKRGKTQKEISVNQRSYPQSSASIKADVAASFQQAVVDVLVKKTARAAKEYKAKSILLCGGVSANKALQETLKANSSQLKTNFVVPDFQFNTDNASMIAVAAYINLLQKNKKKLPMEANGNLTL